MTVTLIPNPATERQVAFLTSLLEQKARRVQQIDPENGPEAALATREWVDDLLTGREVLSKPNASKAIDKVKAWLAANAAPAVAAPRSGVVGEGLYIREDTVWKVVRSARGNLYAKRLVPGGRRGRWEYAAGAVRDITPADVLTPEKAAEYGRRERIGHDGEFRVYCACCGAELDTQESRDRGIGPVCYARQFG